MSTWSLTRDGQDLCIGKIEFCSSLLRVGFGVQSKSCTIADTLLWSGKASGGLALRAQKLQLVHGCLILGIGHEGTSIG